ncbi:globin domain-containing protein [Bosea psychrotolerans]|uniref:Nitric oxide dioxygenase n=1 Tax=Bosea psychrotolerans TaxID=1871628 RepID=A0A2S4M2E7_9HYPH|nr:globin domain-containing protein [Bosea psychrotolerans]POR48871.1 nitric oxide dioxygenase [Bosea psychrotolerans]
MFKDDDVQRIRDSFAHLHRRKAETGAIFYNRLFEIAPEVRPLFKGDIKAQGIKLMEMLTVAIATLNDREGLAILLRKLGRQHKGYGVKDSHYDSVREALIWTLRTSLGDAFTPRLERVWTQLYNDIASVMIAASHAE